MCCLCCLISRSLAPVTTLSRVTSHVSSHIMCRDIHTSSHQWWFVTSIITCHAGHHMTSHMPDITGYNHRHLTSDVIITCHVCHHYVVTMAPTLTQELPASETQIPVSSPEPSQPLSHLLHPHPAPRSRSRSLTVPPPWLWAGPTLTLVTTLHHLNTNPRQAEDLDIQDLVSIQMQID